MGAIQGPPNLTAAIESSRDVAEVGAATRQVAAALGFDHFLFGFRVPLSFTKPCQFILSGYPRAWRERYDQQSYLAIDPVLTRALGSVIPFAWDELDKSDPAVARLFEEAAQFGLRHGFSVPVHGAHGEGGVLSLARERPLPVTAAERQQLFQQAQWFTAVLHQKLLQLVFKDRLPLRRAQLLTRRERECLRFAADGLSAPDIARNMNIAERTVVFHLKHAEQKLGAKRRQHAVARAVAMGQVEPGCYPARFSESAQFIELN